MGVIVRFVAVVMAEPFHLIGIWVLDVFSIAVTLVAVIVVVAAAMLVMLVHSMGKPVLLVPVLLLLIVVFAGLVMDALLPTTVLVGGLGLLVVVRQLPLISRVVVAMSLPSEVVLNVLMGPVLCGAMTEFFVGQ